MIQYRPLEEEERRRLFADADTMAHVFVAPQRDWRGTSYAAVLLLPSADLEVWRVTAARVSVTAARVCVCRAESVCLRRHIDARVHGREEDRAA